MSLMSGKNKIDGNRHEQLRKMPLAHGFMVSDQSLIKAETENA